MCRFMAVISTKSFDPEPYIKELERQAESGKNSPHGDSWGLWLKTDNYEILHRETSPIWDRKIKFPEGRILLAHARKKGEKGAEVSLKNTHPFLRGNAVFMHNGVVKIKKHLYAQGNTDSESYFLHLLDMGILSGVRYVAENYKFISLNCVIYRDGKIYVVRVTPKNDKYHTIFLKKEESRIAISTEGDGVLVPNGKALIIDENLKIEERNIFPHKYH